MHSWALATMISIAFFGHAQEPFEVNKIKKEDAVRIEEKLGSKAIALKSKVYVSKDFFPDVSRYQLDQPLLFVREEKDFSYDLEVQYFFSKADDSVRLVIYSWGTGGYTNGESSAGGEDVVNSFNKKYDELMSMLAARFGPPGEGTGQPVKRSSGLVEWIERKAKWKPGNADIELTMICSTNPAPVISNGAKSVPTFRVRLKVY